MSEEKKSSGCLKKGCFISCFGCFGITALVLIVIFVSVRSFISDPTVIPNNIFLTENCEGYINLKISKDNKAGAALLQKILSDIKHQSDDGSFKASMWFDEKNAGSWLPISADAAFYARENTLRPVFCFRLNKFGYFSKAIGWIMKFAADNNDSTKQYSQYAVGQWDTIFEWDDNGNTKKSVAFIDNNILITHSRADMEWAISTMEKHTNKNKKDTENPADDSVQNSEIHNIISTFPAECIGKGTILNKDPERFMKLFTYLKADKRSIKKNDETEEPDEHTKALLEQVKNIQRVDVKVLPETDEFFIVFDFITDNETTQKVVETFFDEVNKNNEKPELVELFKTEKKPDRITATTVITVSNIKEKTQKAEQKK